MSSTCISNLNSKIVSKFVSIIVYQNRTVSELKKCALSEVTLSGGKENTDAYQRTPRHLLEICYELGQQLYVNKASAQLVCRIYLVRLIS